jgi:hypothetical protein
MGRIRWKRLARRIGLCLVLVVAAGPEAPPGEIRQDFRGGNFDPQLFRVMGPDAASHIRTDAKGLRIRLPPEHGNKNPVGIKPTFNVGRDFEVTVWFELVNVDNPVGGHGAGVSIWIRMASPTNEAATIARLVKPNGDQVFIANRGTTSEDGKRRFSGPRPVPSEARSGALRLARKGSTLFYYFAAGEGAAFRELYQAELGTENLEIIRIAADNGGSPTAVDVRLRAVSLRGDSLPGEAVRPDPPPRRWPLWLAAGLGVALAAAGGSWLWWRSARAGRAAAGPGPPGGRSPTGPGLR